MKRYHMMLDVAGAIRNRSFKGFPNRKTGGWLTPKEAERRLRLLAAHGVKLIPMGDGPCPDFSQETGCPGHEVEDKQEERR